MNPLQHKSEIKPGRINHHLFTHLVQKHLCATLLRIGNNSVLYLEAAFWLAHSVTSLPGHEGLQHSHALFGEVVLSNDMLQSLEVAGDHNHRFHLILALKVEDQKH